MRVNRIYLIRFSKTELHIFPIFVCLISSRAGRTMIEWALDMDLLIDESMAIIKWAMKDMEQILFPWVKYNTNDLLVEYVNPYIYNGVVNVLDVSPDFGPNDQLNK